MPEDKPEVDKREQRGRKKTDEKSVEETSEERVAKKLKQLKTGEKEERSGDEEGKKKTKLPLKPSPKKESPAITKTKEQAKNNLHLFTKSLNCKKEAKKEEDEYLKLRKQQLLTDFLPKSKAAKMRRSDEKFPCNQLRDMEKWNFGAIKAKYLALRPSGKYANWFGKSHDEKHKHEKCITIKDRILLQRQQNGKKSQNTQKEPPPLKEIPRPRGTTSPLDDVQKSGHIGGLDADGFDEEEVMMNIRYSSVLNEKGLPFWLEEADHAETEEEEAIVTKEAVQKDGQEAVDKKKDVPGRVGDFDPTAPIKQLVKYDKFFNPHEVYLLTINNVVEIWREEPPSTRTPTEPARPQQITWNTKMIVADYEKDLASIVAKKGISSIAKDLKDVVKSGEN